MRGTMDAGAKSAPHSPGALLALLRKVLLTLLILAPFSVQAQTLIQRTITIDGNMSDWTSPTNILTNPGQFATDPVGVGDGDAPVQSSGRDLKTFAYTWDNNNLYLYVERAGSSSNVTDWWFYVDTNSNGLMQTGEKVFHISWQGSNQVTNREVCNYVPSASGGDPIVSPVTGRADGYDMPGTITGCVALSSATGGNAGGVQMETALPWTSLGFAGPSAVGFHISSSNGSNIPAQVDDNMDGPNTNFLLFADNAIAKTITSGGTLISGTNNVPAGENFTYSLTLSNLSTSNSTSIAVSDVLPAGLTYVSHTAPGGTTAVYNAGTRTLTWNVPFLGASNPPTTITTLTLTLTVTANLVSVDTTITNTATITSRDLNASNNTSSLPALIRAAAYTLVKTQTLVSDPVNGTSNPRAIPGAIIEYAILATSFGGLSDNNSVRIVDPIPANAKMFVGDIGGTPAGPMSFTQGTPSSTLSFGSVEYSNNNGATWTYVPTAGPDGCDANVTHFRLNASGTFASGVGLAPAPNFTARFRVCVK